MVKLSVNYERTSVCVFKKLKHSFVWRKHETQITLLHARKGERERERERMEHNTRRRRQGGKCRWQRVEIGKLSARKKPQKRTNDCSI